MRKRNLRVVKWVDNRPALGLCSICLQRFKVPLPKLTKTVAATEELRSQFLSHRCERKDAA